MLVSLVERVAAVAEGQQGAVSMKQLAQAGLSERQARVWVRHERLSGTAARGVFRMPGAGPTWKQALWVAILAGPKATVASHLSAAALRGLLPPPEFPHVTVPRTASGRFAGAAERLTAALAPYTGGAEPRSEKEAHIVRVFHHWGLPPPVTQYVIRDESGRFLAKVDFAWPAWRFGLEYKGDEFHPPRAWARDDRRLARIEAVAWRIEESDRFDLRPSATRLRTLLTGLLGQAPFATQDGAAP